MTASRSLYLLTTDADALRALVDAHADAHEGDITDILPVIEQWEKEIDASVERKVEACVRLMREWEATAAARREEAKRLTEAAKADSARVERLEAYVRDCLLALEKPKVQAGPYAVSVQRAGGKSPLIIEKSIDDLPERLLRVTVEPDKEKIRAELEAGKTVTGCSLGERALVLRVR